MPDKLQASFQPYAWGSTSFIQTLCSLKDLMGKPLAEMWLGAHPKAPSLLFRNGQEIPLNEFIAADPEQNLGNAAKMNDAQLPFLLKVLAAGQALSIQVHPDKAAAEIGFAAENAAGIDINDPKRSFKDANHKPELLYALSPFVMLSGFRPYGEIIHYFRKFNIRYLWHSFSAFADKPNPETFKNLFSKIMNSPESQLHSFGKLIEQPRNSSEEGLVQIQQLCEELIVQHRLDVGIVAPLLMNVITLSPGEAIYLDAGILHAYVKGYGIEVMANSDNVIRGGLTTKFIDLPKLIAHTQFSPCVPKPVAISQVDETRMRYLSPASEFELQTMELDGSYQLQSHGSPRIILCMEGSFSCNDTMQIMRGEAIFIAANEANTLLSGTAKLVSASLPEA